METARPVHGQRERAGIYARRLFRRNIEGEINPLIVPLFHGIFAVLHRRLKGQEGVGITTRGEVQRGRGRNGDVLLIVHLHVVRRIRLPVRRGERRRLHGISADVRLRRHEDLRPFVFVFHGGGPKRRRPFFARIPRLAIPFPYPAPTRLPPFPPSACRCPKRSFPLRMRRRRRA